MPRRSALTLTIMPIEPRSSREAVCYRCLTRDLRPFCGLLCPGLCFFSGQCVSLFSWGSAPVQSASFSQIWIRDTVRERIYYPDPLAANGVLRFYHRFDQLIGAQIDLKWNTHEILRVRVSAEAVSLDLEIRVAAPFVVGGVNCPLRTPAKTLLSSRGTTEIGKRYVRQPHRLVAVRDAQAILKPRPGNMWVTDGFSAGIA